MPGKELRHLQLFCVAVLLALVVACSKESLDSISKPPTAGFGLTKVIVNGNAFSSADTVALSAGICKLVFEFATSEPLSAGDLSIMQKDGSIEFSVQSATYGPETIAQKRESATITVDMKIPEFEDVAIFQIHDVERGIIGEFKCVCNLAAP